MLTGAFSSFPAPPLTPRQGTQGAWPVHSLWWFWSLYVELSIVIARMGQGHKPYASLQALSVKALKAPE